MPRQANPLNSNGPIQQLIKWPIKKPIRHQAAISPSFKRWQDVGLFVSFVEFSVLTFLSSRFFFRVCLNCFSAAQANQKLKIVDRTHFGNPAIQKLNSAIMKLKNSQHHKQFTQENNSNVNELKCSKSCLKLIFFFPRCAQCPIQT